MVDRLAAQQVLGRLDKTGDAHIGAEKVVGDPRPTEQLGALARRVDDLDSVVRDPRIVAREARQRRHFGRAEQPRQEQQAVALERRDLVRIQALGGGGRGHGRVHMANAGHCIGSFNRVFRPCA